jgi:hypothetical protein
MGRFTGSGGYGHHCEKIETRWGTWYEISWMWDRYYKGSRLRFPTGMTRETDEVGARRFCKKWNIPFPGSEDENSN